FRLRVIVADETGCLNVLLWNTECAAILGKSPNDVRDISKNEKGNGYPKIFDQIVDKKYLFKISVKSQNISSLDQTYAVCKISNDKSLIEVYSSQVASTEENGVDQSLDIALPSAGTVESSSDGSGERVVSLAK
ncbi:hypothetical protein PIB30_105721, partial [Stylosanthes scabra]|nr:hypothetical protein [Stylosanthes scabra]